MKGDFSRSTFDPTRHYSGVRMQQGRVQLDADWNEQADLARHRVETEALDTLGRCGGPLHAAGFGVVRYDSLSAAEQSALTQRFPQYTPGPAHGVITPGRYYVNGVLCQNEHPVPLLHQPDLPGPWAPQPVSPVFGAAGFYLLYLDVWERHVTALEHPRLRETALGGPDTATRTRTVWQVRAQFLRARGTTGEPAPECGEGALPTAPTGRLQARAEPDAADPGPCVVPPGAGYRGLENQLYRVEIHAPGDALDLAAGGSSVAVTGADPQTRTVTVDAGIAWVVGDTAELFLTAAGSDPQAGTVARVVNVAGSTLTLSGTFPAVEPPQLPRLRRITGATWKWSRDNGIVVSRILAIDEAKREISLESLGADDVLDFRPGMWVEITDDHHELNGLPGQLLQVESRDDTARRLVVRTTPTKLATNAQGVDPARTPKLRRWDGVGSVKTGPATAYATLEPRVGVQVRFSAGGYRTGDYWLIPARTATGAPGDESGSVEWPREGSAPAALAPMGIVHHYCRLAVVEWLNRDGIVVPGTDCRCLFVPLSTVPALHYVSGAGQEALPTPPYQAAKRVRLGLPLVVGMANAACHAGAQVRFRRLTGEGRVGADGNLPSPPATSQVDIPIGPDGLARCWWWVDGDTQHQLVEARLVGAPSHPPILFNASLSVADQVAYDPLRACEGMAADGVETVQQAIDWLCAHRGGGGCDVTVGEGGDFPTIAAAITTLLKPGGSVCICLLRGEHVIQEDIAIAAEGGAVKITGCGTGTKILIKEPLRVGPLASFILRDLDVTAVGVERPFRFEGCQQIHIDNCGLLSYGETPLINVTTASRVRITACNALAALPIRQPTTGGTRTLRAASPRKGAAASKTAGKVADAEMEKIDFQGAMEEVSKAVLERGTAARREAGAGFLQQMTALLAGTGDADAQPRAGRPAAGTSAVSTGVVGFSYGYATLLALTDTSPFVNLEDNVFFGFIRLHGNGTGAPLDGVGLDNLVGASRAGELDQSGSNLVLRGNALAGIHLDPTLGDVPKGTPIPVFRNVNLTDNEIIFPSLLLGGQVKLTSNQFQMPSLYAMHVFGVRLNATGNAAAGNEVGIRYTAKSLHEAGNAVYFTLV